MLKRINWYFFIAIIIISILSVVTLVSTQIDETGKIVLDAAFNSQIGFIILGIITFLIVSKWDVVYLKYKQVIIPIYIVTIILLILTLIFGDVVKGAKRWLDTGLFMLQPSEIVKLIVIFTTAYIFTQRDKLNEFILLGLSLLTVLPLIALVFIQPHGSMSLILLILWLLTSFTMMRNQFQNIMLIVISLLTVIGLWGFLFSNLYTWLLVSLVGIIISIFLFYSKNDWKVSIIVVLIVSIIFGLGGNFLWKNVVQDYQKERIVSYFDDDDPETKFQVEQAKIAIGSGQLTGKGFGNGSQVTHGFLPENDTDFIFATYAEQFGFIGSIFLIAMYGVILYIPLRYIFTVESIDPFFITILLLLLLKVLLEIFINLGTNLDIVPATGIPLPLMSAGGTITIMTYFSLGIIQSIMSNGVEDGGARFRVN